MSQTPVKALATKPTTTSSHPTTTSSHPTTTSSHPTTTSSHPTTTSSHPTTTSSHPTTTSSHPTTTSSHPTTTSSHPTTTTTTPSSHPTTSTPATTPAGHGGSVPPPPPPPPAAPISVPSSNIQTLTPARIDTSWTNPPHQRTLQLISYDSTRFKSHWAFWVPSLTHSSVGKLVHVKGDVLNGFTYEVKRNYDLTHTSQAYTIYNLGHMSVTDLIDTPGDGQLHNEENSAAQDEFERVVRGVPAPTGSLNTPASLEEGTPRRRAQINCQIWIKRALEALIAAHRIDAQSLVRLRQIPLTTGGGTLSSLNINIP